MILPYGSDQDDGYIGYHSIGIILLCFLGFALTWPREVHLQETLAQDSVKVWYENEIADQEKRFQDAQTPGIEDRSELHESNSQASIDSLDDH